MCEGDWFDLDYYNADDEIKVPIMQEYETTHNARVVWHAWPLIAIFSAFLSSATSNTLFHVFGQIWIYYINISCLILNDTKLKFLSCFVESSFMPDENQYCISHTIRWKWLGQMVFSLSDLPSLFVEDIVTVLLVYIRRKWDYDHNAENTSNIVNTITTCHPY